VRRWKLAGLAAAIILLLLPFLPEKAARAAGGFGLSGTVTASKTNIYIGEEFTLKYTVNPYAASGQSGQANFKFPKIVQPIPYGFAIVSFSGDVFGSEVEIKYNELRISFNEFNYKAGTSDPQQVTVKLVYKGKPARHALGRAALEYTVNDDWSTRNPTSFSAPVLTFTNRIEGPATRMTDPQLVGTLSAPASTVYIGDSFSLQYALSPNIEIERRDQSDYILLWDISKSMESEVPSSSEPHRQRLDAARYGIKAFVQRLRELYPDDEEEDYRSVPTVNKQTNAKSSLRENQFVSSWTKSKPLTQRTGPQTGKAPRVTLIPFDHDIQYDHIVEQTNDYTYLTWKTDSMHVMGSHSDVTRVLHETMDYILYEREHGNPDYRPAVILMTDGGFDTYTRINNEKYEARYSTDSKTAGEINRAVEATYDFDNLYLAMGIPLHMIRLDDPGNTGLNYREGFNAVENIVSKSGGRSYRAIDRNNRSYGGVSYTGTENAYIDLVNRTEAGKKPWGDYKNIVINQPLPAGYSLDGAQGNITLSGGLLKIPLSNFIYNSGQLRLNKAVRLVYTGAPGTYRLQDAYVSFQANGSDKTNSITGKNIVFKSKNPPTVEVTAPDDPNGVINSSFIIVRGREPAFSIRATKQMSYDDPVQLFEYGFAQSENETVVYKELWIDPERYGADYTLAFNSGGGSVSRRFEQYGWYRMVTKVTNTGGLSTTKVMYILVLPELDFRIEVDQPAAAVSYKPVVAMLRWTDPELKQPVASKFGFPALATQVEYSLSGQPWKPAVFDKIHLIRQSSNVLNITVRVTQSFEAGAKAPFNGITFSLDKKQNYSINYDQNKY
jgi:hypothetical protein